MKLYFLRHGIADWPDWDLARDQERPLTQEGVKKAKAEARAIARLDLQLDAILASPYARAYQTADLVASKLGLEVHAEPLLAPGFNLERLEEILRAHPAASALMLVGHEPSFSAVIVQLIGGGRIVMKKGSLARVDVDTADSLRGELVWLLTARTLTR